MTKIATAGRRFVHHSSVTIPLVFFSVFTVIISLSLLSPAQVPAQPVAPPSNLTVGPVGGFSFWLATTGSQSVTAGSSVTNIISATLASGSTQPISFSVSGLPSGSTDSFAKTSCSPNCSSTLTLTTSSSTPAGSYPITVAATGGGVTNTTTFNLTVSLPTVAMPAITPNGGSYTGSVSVTIQTATSGASIYYTTNGSTPTQSSTLYTGAMTLTSSATVKAKAFKSGYSASSEASASFTISQPSLSGANLWVSKSGSNLNACTDSVTNPGAGGSKLTIAAAIACPGFTPGSTIHIGDGTYNEFLSMVAADSGTSWSNTTKFMAVNNGQIIINGIHVIGAGVRYFEFTGLDLNGGGLTVANGAQYVGFYFGISRNARGQGIACFDPGNDQNFDVGCRITDSEIYNNGEVADIEEKKHNMYFTGNGHLVARNRIHNAISGYGLQFQGGGNGSPGSIIMDNEFYNNHSGGLLLNVDNVEVSRNVFRGNTGYGAIRITGGSSNPASGNKIWNNEMYGGTYGLTLSRYAWNTEVKNNIFRDNTQDVLISGDHNQNNVLTFNIWQDIPFNEGTNTTLADNSILP